MRCAPQLDSNLWMKAPGPGRRTAPWLQGRTLFMRWVLVQAQRLDCRFVNCARDGQVVIALEVGQGRSRVNAQRARYFSIIISCILQGGLDVRDHLVWEQITVSVDR